MFETFRGTAVPLQQPSRGDVSPPSRCRQAPPAAGRGAAPRAQGQRARGPSAGRRSAWQQHDDARIGIAWAGLHRLRSRLRGGWTRGPIHWPQYQGPHRRKHSGTECPNQGDPHAWKFPGHRESGLDQRRDTRRGHRTGLQHEFSETGYLLRPPVQESTCQCADERANWPAVEDGPAKVPRQVAQRHRMANARHQAHYGESRACACDDSIQRARSYGPESRGHPLPRSSIDGRHAFA